VRAAGGERLYGSLTSRVVFCRIALSRSIKRPQDVIVPTDGIHRAAKEQRRKPRRQFHYRARILISEKAQPRNCQIADISESGARIILERDEVLPSRFLLLLSARAGTRRICRLVWRKGLTVGVQFPKDS
jgi:hypothetical protein